MPPQRRRALFTRQLRKNECSCQSQPFRVHIIVPSLKRLWLRSKSFITAGPGLAYAFSDTREFLSDSSFLEPLPNRFRILSPPPRIFTSTDHQRSPPPTESDGRTTYRTLASYRTLRSGCRLISSGLCQPSVSGSRHRQKISSVNYRRRPASGLVEQACQASVRCLFRLEIGYRI